MYGISFPLSREKFGETEAQVNQSAVGQAKHTKEIPHWHVAIVEQDQKFSGYRVDT